MEAGVPELRGGGQAWGSVPAALSGHCGSRRERKEPSRRCRPSPRSLARARAVSKRTQPRASLVGRRTRAQGERGGGGGAAAAASAG